MNKRKGHVKFGDHITHLNEEKKVVHIVCFFYCILCPNLTLIKEIVICC